MTCYENFNIDFITRTLKILEDYTGEYDVTSLINCAVGLIIIPKEQHFNCLRSINIQTLEEIYGITKPNIRYSNDDSLSNIVRHMRNSIAHGKITQEKVKDNKIKSLRFRDEYKGSPTFEAIFTIEEFKAFSIAVAKEVISNQIISKHS